MSLNVAPDQSVYESFYSDPKQIWLVKVFILLNCSEFVSIIQFGLNLFITIDLAQLYP
jgi:hypothetical protein